MEELRVGKKIVLKLIIKRGGRQDGDWIHVVEDKDPALRTTQEIPWLMQRLLAQLKFRFMQLFIRKFVTIIHPSDRSELLGSM